MADEEGDNALREKAAEVAAAILANCLLLRVLMPCTSRTVSSLAIEFLG
jgi:hypothetical protein